MIDSKNFYNTLIDNDINFFVGVPDSLLKDICAQIQDSTPTDSHIISANEGSAIALATGYHLATGEVPLVYMQNSGFGNTINPLTSLTDPSVYGVPMILLIGWRGEPGADDEPQHMKKGKITIPLLNTLQIEHIVLSNQNLNIDLEIKKAKEAALKSSSPFAILVRKNTFTKYASKDSQSSTSRLTREKAIQSILEITKNEDAIYFATTGKIGRELYESRKVEDEIVPDFLNVGAMGHTSQIALAASLKTNKKVYCIDGDGSVIMHMGSLATIGQCAKSNFVHIMLNNGSHDSVGGQPTLGFQLDFKRITLGCGYNQYFKATSTDEIKSILQQENQGPVFIEVIVAKGARKDLGRPKESPLESKEKLMSFIKS